MRMEGLREDLISYLISFLWVAVFEFAFLKWWSLSHILPTVNYSQQHHADLWGKYRSISCS